MDRAMRRHFILAALSSLFATATTPALASPTIIDLGTLPGGTASFGMVVSHDGSVVAGQANLSSASGSFRPFRWTASGGMQNLGVFPGGPDTSPSGIQPAAWAMNADGSVLAGSTNHPDASYRAFRWTDAGGLLDLGALSGGTSSRALAISDNGSVVVGVSTSPNGYRAFRWTQPGGMVDLGVLPDASESEGYAVSADGSVVAGTCDTPDGYRPFRWTQAGGMVSIGTPPGAFNAGAHTISADGSVIAGWFGNGGAFRWTEAGGFQDLGVLPGGTYAFAESMSADGTIVVGNGDAPNAFFGEHAMLWTEELGMVDLNDYLPTLGVDLTGWELFGAWDVTPDGSTITGMGFHNGQARAFLITDIAAPPEPCDDAYWDEDFAVPGIGEGDFAEVFATAEFNGELYAGGFFSTADGIAASNIARWDGTQWAPLADGVDGAVFAMTVYDGALYVGGTFTTAGGVTVNNIARWDGSSWSPLTGPSGTGVAGNPGVFALRVFNDTLHVAGGFLSAGGVTARGIATWNGSQWAALQGTAGEGTIGQVRALEIFNGDLHVGGVFFEMGGLLVNGIARWDGADWAPLTGPGGTGVGGTSGVFSLAVHDDGSGQALYVGGAFPTAGGVTANNIARWDGADWSALAGPGGPGLLGGQGDSLGTAWTIQVFNESCGPALYVGGNFATAGGVTVKHIARWDGAQWSALLGSTDVGVLRAAPHTSSTIVRTLSLFDDGSGPALYAGGNFTSAGGTPSSRIARWIGCAPVPSPQPTCTQWDNAIGQPGIGEPTVHPGVNDDIRAMAIFNGALHVGGTFDVAGAVNANNIATWNGSQWSTLAGPGANGVQGVSQTTGVWALQVFENALFAAGNFETAGGLTVNNIARWNGSSWAPLPGPFTSTGVQGQVWALTVFDDGSGPALYVGGNFQNAGGGLVPNLNGIARWDGAAWSSLSGPSDSGVATARAVRALAVYDDGSGPALYAGGDFITAGGVTVNGVARWDGAQWSALAGPGATGVSVGTVVPGRADSVHALAVFDDGSGPALYAGGEFVTAGGVTVNRIAKWDGFQWSALADACETGVGPFNQVLSLYVHDDGRGDALYVGGTFANAGSVAANRIARWDGQSWSALIGPHAAGVHSDYARVSAMIAFNDGACDDARKALYVGGLFTSAGGLPAKRIARWGTTPCAADFNCDCAVTVFDFSIFAANFGAGPNATRAQGDVNGDGYVNVFDFAIFSQQLGHSCD